MNWQKKIDCQTDPIPDQVHRAPLLATTNQTAELPAVDRDTNNLAKAKYRNHGKDIKQGDIKLGLVRCSAFGFYYPDDLQALQDAGAELIEVDPCHQTELPELDALFIGGGFPETHMNELEANKGLRTAIKAAIDNGMPTYAE